MQADLYGPLGGHINHFQVRISHFKPGYPGYPRGQATKIGQNGSLTYWVPWVPRLEKRYYDLEMIYMVSIVSMEVTLQVSDKSEVIEVSIVGGGGYNNSDLGV